MQVDPPGIAVPRIPTAATPIPKLLYHNLCAALHASNTDESVLTVRFSTAVRVESLRIIPEGVACLSGIGATYPSQFTARILFNVSPSNPVNALSTTSIDYDGQKGWEQNYQIGMPEGVSTRMMIVIGKIDRLSLSVYGHMQGLAQPTAGLPAGSQIDLEEQGDGGEDWSWITNWAGGVDGLLGLVDKGASPDKRETAIACLDLLGETDSTIYDKLADDSKAIAYLLSPSSSPVRPVLQRVLDNPKYALHPNARHHLPTGHRYVPLVEGSELARREHAWGMLPDEGALIILKEVGVGDWALRDKSTGMSRLTMLLKALQEWQGSEEGYNVGLGILLAGIGAEWTSALVRLVTPLLVKSHIHGGSRSIDIPLAFSREVLTALLEVPPVLNRKSTLPITSAFAQTYLAGINSSDPLARAFQPRPSTVDPPQSSDERAISRFVQSLHTSTNGYTHILSPTQILTAIAPELLQSLSTAREPPFGLSSVARSTPGQTSASASTFAGKVYSSHDFRTRQLAAEGTGAGGPLTGHGSGLGIGLARGESRPASRHVDDYQTSR
jgi:hypothetical protein